MKKITSFARKFLIAQPMLTDPVFKNSLIIMLSENDGIILNGPIIGEIDIGKVEFENLPDNKKECEEFIKDKMNEAHDKEYIYLGGPVGDAIWMMHSNLELVEPETDQVIDGVWFGGPDILIKSHDAKLKNYRVVRGQATWADGQLEQEIELGAWAVMPASSDLFFNDAKIKKLFLNRSPEFSAN